MTHVACAELLLALAFADLAIAEMAGPDDR